MSNLFIFTKLKASAKLFTLLVLAILLVFGASPGSLVHADNCPPGFSNLDCQALLNGWIDWVPDNCAPGASTTLTGSDNEQKAFNFFVSKELTPVQSAGIIGNLMQESGVDPNAVQANGLGRGIAQWSVGARWDTTPNDNVKSFAAGGNVHDLSIQLNFIWYELSNYYQNVLKNLKATTTVENAVNQFVGPDNLQGKPVPPTAEVQRSGGYENPGQPQMANRINFAKAALSLYGGSTSGTPACGGNVQCNNGAATGSAGLSPVRQKVVCLAQQELARWNQIIKRPPPYLQYARNMTQNNTGPNYAFSYSDGWECNNYPLPPPNCTAFGTTQEWCADFVSWLYKQAGYPFSGGANGWRLANVYQIEGQGVANRQFHLHIAGGYTPKPGDLALHGSNDNTLYHVNMVIAVSGKSVTFIGGDQGSGPYGGTSSASVVSIDKSTDVYEYVAPD